LGGGYSLDLLIGRKTRDHEDLDFIVNREDQLSFQNVLVGWDLQAADPPGTATLFPWKKEHFYQLPVHNIWCRKNESLPWDLEILFSEFEGNEWVSRRKRPKDFQDLHNCLPVLNIKQKANLKDWIAIDSGEEHPWLKLI
jgi:hypothetical protein